MASLDLDRSHDPLRRSWVASANLANSDFPVQNLPFGVFREAGSGKAPRGGVRRHRDQLGLAWIYVWGERHERVTQLLD